MNISSHKDFFETIFDTSQLSGVMSLLVAIISAIATILLSICNYLVLEYDTEINSKATLLTKLHSTLLWILLFYSPVQLTTCLRFATGIQIHPILAKGMTYYTFYLVTFWAYTIAVEAFFHYKFITFKSAFPIIREDLIHSTVVRSLLGFSMVVVGKKFTFDDMPSQMTYYLWSGIEPQKQHYGSKLKKDDAFFMCLIIACYLLFTGLLLYEKLKHKRADADQDHPRTPAASKWYRLRHLCLEVVEVLKVNNSNDYRMSVDIGLCLQKIVFSTALLITFYVFDTADANLLTTGPYWILVQFRMLVLLPTYMALIHECRFRRDDRLCHFIRRKIAEWFQIQPTQIQPIL